MREYHVSKLGCDKNDGTKENPFLTIQKAADIAQPCDTVIVHEGTYREWVAPKNGGFSDVERITYKAADGEKVIIKGSEVVEGWVKFNDTVWTLEVGNSIFSGKNPYADEIWGDWFISMEGVHTGEVYIDGAGLCERENVEIVSENEMTWTGEVRDDVTVLYANFGDKNPGDAVTEINVRECCFAPLVTGINYITVSGFEMAHAACGWTPPTASQPGMIWAKWSKGWIIENNLLHDARCSAVSLGREGSTGDNLTTRYHKKCGYRSQLEVVFSAWKVGWDKENVGSHIVRYNTIYNCGQNGVVGHLGGAFSEIHHNHIYNIGNVYGINGWEIGGIKLHAAIDTYIHHNRIHNCVRGTWLDWQAQGTRVSQNVYYDNGMDLMIEVTHGPHLVDNNIFASDWSLFNMAQGGAYVHNIVAGEIRSGTVLDRSTPYHFAHSTKVLGTAPVYGYDDRFYQNILLGTGTSYYNGCPQSLDEYLDGIVKNYNIKKSMDIGEYINEKQPAYINANVYANKDDIYEKEKEYCALDGETGFKVYEEDGSMYMEFTADEKIFNLNTTLIGTHNLERPRISDQLYENADATPVMIDYDYNGEKRGENPTVGPFEGLKPGKNKIKVW